MNKILIVISFLALVFGLTTSFSKVSHADSNECKKHVYEIDSDEDSESDAHLTFAESGGKVDIIFNNTTGVLPDHNHHNQVIVTAGSGYEIVNVQYELEHYSGIGWTTVPGNNPVTTITLAGVDDDSRIDEVEVKIQTICVTPVPTASVTPSPTSSVTPTPTIEVTGTPTVTPVPTVSDTPTPTNVPSNNGGSNNNASNGSGDGLGCATHDCSGNQVGGPATVTSTGHTQAVLGASTMADTGTFENTLMTLMSIAGMIVLSLGGLSYAKEKNK